MGVQSQSSFDSFRTHWTPAMDRYFINLMLEQVWKGSKIDDHLFSKRAWNNMTVLFNAKFESQYDKDVLKNRHKTLRKLYKAVRKLLDESGFNWDATLQMVTAEDDVWDNYIKAHSDARSYRTKTVPYYSDLCEIYKNESSNVDHDSNLDIDSPETKTDGILEGLKSPVSSVIDNVQESSSLLSENLDISDRQCMDQFLLPSTSPRSNDESMLDYPEMKMDEVLEGSKSSAMTVVYEGGLIGNVEIDMSYEHNMDQPLMPSATVPRNNGDAIVDLSRTKICGVLEGPEALELPVMHQNQVDYAQEPSVSLDVDTTNQQSVQQHVMETPEIRINEMSSGLKSPTISVANVDQLHKSSSHLDVSIDIADQQKMVEVTTNNEPNEQQPVISLSPQRSLDKGVMETVHETVILADKEENGNSITTRNGIDVIQDAPDTNTASGVYRLRTNWTPRMDRYFIDLMLDQVHEGNMIDVAGRKQAWKNMIVLFNAKFSFHYDTDILKNRYKTLRKHYSAVKFLLDQPGFIWDDTRKTVTADDFVWHNYLKAHPDAAQYRTRIMPYYNDLCAIYRDAVVDGTFSTSGNNISAMKTGRSLINLQLLTTSDTHEDPYNQQNKRRLVTPSTPQDPKKLRSNCDMGMADALREMATAVSSLADKKKENTTTYSIENVIYALQSLPDIDDDLLLDACDFLEDERKGKTFLALDVALRKKWLMRKLRA